MYISVIDGSVCFASHEIILDVPIEIDHPLWDGKIIVFPHENLDTIQAKLDSKGAKYTINKLKHNPLHKEKAQGILYASRSEAINHLLNDVEPNSQIVPNLKKRLDEKEKRVVTLETELNTIKDKLKTKGVL